MFSRRHAVTAAVLAGLVLVMCNESLNSPPDQPWCHNQTGIISVDSVYRFEARAIDPDEDSVCYRIAWGDGDTSEWTGFVPSGTPVSIQHSWEFAGSYQVRAQARDQYDALSVWSEPELLAVKDSHPVLWVWEDSEVVSSPLLLDAAGEHLLYFGDGDARFCAVDLAGTTRYTAVGAVENGEEYFSSHPAWCAATGNIIVGNDEGELHAFRPDLTRSWHWPGNNNEESADYLFWGTAAVCTNRVYVSREDDEYSSVLFYFLDLGDQGCMMNRFNLEDEWITAGPVIDADGNVVFGTDMGILRKLSPDLQTVLWSDFVGGWVSGLALGPDGTVYACSDDPGTVTSFSPDGGLNWEVTLTDGVMHPVIGSDALFVGTDAGVCYSLDLDDGSVNWQRVLECGMGYDDCIESSPLITDEGLVYFQGDFTLYCLRQSDGRILWQNDLLEVEGCRAKTLSDEIANSPLIVPNGDIIVALWEWSLCRVSGYQGDRLADAPWPKWQHDLHNTGSLAGE